MGIPQQRVIPFVGISRWRCLLYSFLCSTSNFGTFVISASPRRRRRSETPRGRDLDPRKLLRYRLASPCLLMACQRLLWKQLIPGNNPSATVSACLPFPPPPLKIMTRLSYKRVTDLFFYVPSQDQIYFNLLADAIKKTSLTLKKRITFAESCGAQAIKRR